MKVNYDSKSGQFGVEFEGKDHKDVFEQVAKFQEIFEEKTCGKCKKSNIRFSVREVDGNKFYELVCREPQCRAKLAFGVHKQGGTLFPKRKSDDGTFLENNGWVTWVNPKKDEK